MCLLLVKRALIPTWGHLNLISPRPPLLRPSHWGSGLQCVHLGGHTHSVHRFWAFHVGCVWCGLRATSPPISAVGVWSPLTHFPSTGSLPSCLAFPLCISLCRSQAQAPAWVLSPRDRAGLGPRGWLRGGEQRTWRAFARCAATCQSRSCPGYTRRPPRACPGLDF